MGAGVAVSTGHVDPSLLGLRPGWLRVEQRITKYSGGFPKSCRCFIEFSLKTLSVVYILTLFMKLGSIFFIDLLIPIFLFISIP